MLKISTYIHRFRSHTKVPGVRQVLVLKVGWGASVCIYIYILTYFFMLQAKIPYP